MKIELLADNTEILPSLVDWYEREWSPYYGVDGPGDAQFLNGEHGSIYVFDLAAFG